VGVRVRQNLLLACVLAGFAAATRNVGIFVVVPLIYEWIKAGGLKERRETWRGLSSLGAVRLDHLHGFFVDEVR
jgi:hypothetical protein